MKTFRKTLARASIAVSANTGSDTTSLKISEISEQTSRVRAALESYLTKVAAAETARGILIEELAILYPQNGPLENALSKLASNEGTSPWSDEASKARVEDLRTYLAQPLAGLSKMTDEYVEKLKQREILKGEWEHYTAKVGKLQDEFVQAKEGTAAKDKAKQKLDENRAKLSTANEAYASMKAEVDKIASNLDKDTALVLTPTINHVVQAFRRFYGEAGSYIDEAMTGVAEAVEASKKEAGQHILAVEAKKQQAAAFAAFSPSPAPSPATAGAGSAGDAASISAAAAVPAAVAVASSSSSSPGKAAADNASADSSSGGVGSGPCLVRALADYTAAQDGDLSFKKRDLVLVLQKNADGWWQGRRGQDFGVMPSNFVAELKEGGGPNNAMPEPSCWMTASFDFATDDASEVSLKSGEVVGLLNPVAALETEDWLLVQTASSKAVGYAPRSYLKQSGEPPASASSSSSGSASARSRPSFAAPAPPVAPTPPPPRPSSGSVSSQS